MAVMFQPILRFYRLSPLWGAGAAADRRLLCRLHAGIGAAILVGQGRHVEGPGAGRIRPRRAERGMSECRRTPVRQGPQGREFSRRLGPDRAPAPPAGAGLLQFRARRRRCLRQSHRRRRTKSWRCWNRCAPVWWARAMRCPKAWHLRDDAGRARPVAGACAGPAGSLPPRLHQAALSRLGRSDRLLPLFAPCRWAALCWMCMAKAQSLWPANDALCAALQVINHLQDCGKDYRELNRVYIPEPLLAGGSASRRWRRHRANPALAGGDRRPGAAKMPNCWNFAALLTRHKRRPACAGSRSHPDPGRRSQQPADEPRSAVQARASFQDGMWPPCS